MVSLISRERNLLLLIDKTSLIYQNVELKAKARFFSSHVEAFE
jgi:hypothetical protein